ncbi:4-hydroxythreonine-4-phosphate dehydrogenase PdxA [Azospirillum picis]|uniref:4-hydroxythreonine-4-phosphate dehydrogenase n=1 Tax=Azospirillum picis TaxID=488438 RepID=A0ABU0MTE4_9PROT|nr:4-hydroxythreonine-4-phosphate dehydrogenase PdxA [Azospirillum picis]MBP2303006.1 4-hydroxythreonine-4-phosphate dehydrogenase [Azospirillum picis]MDQ0536758.1 4-hydroxythreonine-4-phosphate dehydrogenase [Azospirillum picis]
MDAPPAGRQGTGLPLAVTMGEPAGIGGEITLKAWMARAGDGAPPGGLPPFFVIDDPARLAALAAGLGLAVPVRAIASPAEAPALFGHALPVLPVELSAPVQAGRPDPANGAAVIAAIDGAVALVRGGEAAAVVTNPIQKSALYAAGFRHPGHTEYLAHLAGMAEEPIMMLAAADLRVVPVTIHVALRDAVDRLSTEAIVHAGRVTAAALARDFGIARPRLAVAGLNPHAGEGGAMGREDIDIVAPAVAALRAEGIDASGPRPADTMFHAAARRGYDAALCMYHDQALIPVKTVDFDGGVNVTLGLPFVRTSPDHGTALDIAGSGVASPGSLIVALATADRMARNRRAATSRP